MSKHILLFEPNNKGHHPTWLRYLTHDFLNTGNRLTLAIDLNNQGLMEHLKEESPGLFEQVNCIDAYTTQGKLIGGSPLASLAHIFQKSKADFAFCASLDEFISNTLRLAALGINPPRCLKGKLSGVYHRPRPIDPSEKGFTNSWKHLGMKRLTQARWLNHIFLVDEFLAQTASITAPGASYHWLPDPWDGLFTEDKSAARALLNVPSKRPILLHYGVGARRKGLHLVLKAMEALPHAERPFLIVAGRLQNDIPLLTELEWFEKQGQALVLNRYISSKEEVLAFAAADLVLLPYIDHYGSANVLSRAAAAKKPVIASNFHLIGHRVYSYKLGYTFENDSIHSLIHTLKTALAEGPEAWERFQPGLTIYADKTSRTAFAKALTDPFEQ